MAKNDISKARIYNNPLIRTQLLVNTDVIISQLQDRLSVQRFRFTEGDEIKLENLKVYLSAILIKNEVLRDTQLDDIRERLDAIERLQAGESADSKGKKGLFDF